MDNLLSGAIGAVLGAGIGGLVVWLVSNRERVHIAKQHLRILLLQNGYVIYWDPEAEPWKVVEANRVAVHAAYLSVRSLSFVFERTRLDAAWKEYVGVEHYDALMADEPAKVFAKSAVSRQEALDRTISLLKVTR